ncbi:ABC transporter substrate-binding protein [Streptomyces sp. NPDC007984]|uniref:ABC transporter substrate-binding protein n=1 Tax=Streptomyces sp. NPDC007984 TaxID=3364801 RepID=UPI0036E32A5E
MRRSLIPAAAVAVALALTLSACADDEGGAASSSGDSALRPTGKPLRIGWMNLEGGAVSVPETRIGAEAGVRYVNQHLNGVGGRPLELVRCDVDGSPEKSVDCANKMAEEKVAFVLNGIDPGGDATLPVLSSAGIPLLGHGADGPAMQADKNSMFFGAAAPAGLTAPLRFFAGRDVSSYTFLMPDVKWGKSITEQVLVPTARTLGMTQRTLEYDIANPDWSALAASAAAGRPDLVGGPILTDDQCVGLVGALRSSGYQGKIFGGGCSGAVAEALGDASVKGMVTFSDVWRADSRDQAPAAKRKEIDTYVSAMEDSGHEDTTFSVFAQSVFADVVNISRILAKNPARAEGRPALDAVKKAGRFDSFMGTTLNCDGKAWPGQSNCGNSVLFYEYQDDGKVKIVSDGFVGASPSGATPSR